LTRWVIALVAAAALVAVPSAISDVVLAPTVSHTAKLPPGAVATFGVACPPRQLAVSAGVYAPAPGVATLAVRPAGSRSYRFRVANPGANPAQRVTAAVACRRIAAVRSPAPYLKMRPVRLKPLAIRPMSQRTVSLNCPAGTLPAGSAFDLDPAGRIESGHFSGLPLTIRRQTETLRGFSFSVRNSGKTTRSAAFYGACLTVVRPAGAPTESLQVKVTTSSTPVRPGTQVFEDSCTRGWFSLATGFSLRPGLTLGGSAAITGRGRWTVTNASSAPVVVALQLVCGRLSG
jgi:hypothetical protein